MRLLVMMATFALTSGLFVAPAQASGELGLSRDGKTWVNHLAGSLFDPDIRWVPGDERVSAFYLRNQAGDDADLAISVESSDADRLLSNQDISVSARVDGTGWVSLDRVSGVYPLSTRVIGSGETERVEVKATFDSASTNQSQTKSVNLDFRVILSDATAGNGTDPGGTDGLLPDTGAPAMGWALLVAAVMIGAGLALVRRSRDEEVRHG